MLNRPRYGDHTNDPGSFDDYGLYYFHWDGETFSKQVARYGSLEHTKGTGNYFTVADLNGDKRPDWVVAGKDGLCIFFNEEVSH